MNMRITQLTSCWSSHFSVLRRDGDGTLKRELQLLLFVAMSFLCISAKAQDTNVKPVKGEHLIISPAMKDGLCVHNLFQPNMVIQRGKPIVVWGWADSGETVTVSFAEKDMTAKAAKDRSWKVTFPAQPANSTPQTMTITSKGERVSLENILVGDVWIAGGQSNMQHPLSRVEGGTMEIVSANYDKIRLLTVPAMIDNESKHNFPRLHRWENGHHREGFWDVCSPKTVREFTAIGYAFARRLHMVSQVPIGIIDASRWGTTVEAWTPIDELRKMETPSVKTWLAEWDQKVADYEPKKALEARVKWYNDRTERMKKEGRDVSKRTPPTVAPPSPVANQNHPGNCYASLIAPLTGFGVTGAIYHQGFNNSRVDADEFYYAVMLKMIAAWRATFNDPEMAFGIISLCTDSAPQTLDNYAESMFNFGIYVREAQYKTFLDLYKAGDKNIGFASSFDLRRAWYHPQHKIPAGERIARWALATQYGLEGKIHWKPPMVTKMDVKDGAIHLHFDSGVGVLETGAAIEGFAISGSDKKYQPAIAKPLEIGKDGRGRPRYDQKILVLTSPHVTSPIHYRYAWGRNPMGNLRYSAMHLKDIPFATQRSDNWKFYEVPFLDPPEDKGTSRATHTKIREALKLVDLERRQKDAELYLEKNGKAFDEQMKAYKAKNK